MNRYLWIAAVFFVVALIAGIFTYIVLYPPLIHPMRMVFFASGTLAVPMLLVGLIKQE
jgi:hypothetical protein